MLEVRLLATIMRLHVLQAALDLGTRDVVATAMKSARKRKIIISAGLQLRRIPFDVFEDIRSLGDVPGVVIQSAEIINYEVVDLKIVSVKRSKFTQENSLLEESEGFADAAFERVRREFGPSVDDKIDHLKFGSSRVPIDNSMLTETKDKSAGYFKLIQEQKGCD